MKKRVRGLLSGSFLLLGVLNVTAASAQTAAPKSYLAVTSSAGLVAAVTTLSQPGHDETTVAAQASGTVPGAFVFSGASYGLAKGRSPDLPYVALAPGGTNGIAFLFALPQSLAVANLGEGSREARYALATAKGSRVALWELYTVLPDPIVLRQRMLAAIAHLQPPIATFDLNFQPSNDPGPAAYLLK